MVIRHGLASGHFLQRQRRGATTKIHGNCTTDGPVLASISLESHALAGFKGRRIGYARQGIFACFLTGLPAGGPYEITLTRGPESVTVSEIFAGDLWLMAGQSNMEGAAFMEGAAAPHPQVRCFTMARQWEQAREPLHLKLESPDPIHDGLAISSTAAAKIRRSAKKGAGVGLHFGRLMYARTGVPQGLIATARGGSTMEQWSPARRRLGGKSLYGSMLLSLRAVDQPLAGILWAQGESEALPALAKVYRTKMRRLIAAVRKDLGQKKTPWLMVQIGRFIRNPLSTDVWPDQRSWNEIQEQQRLLPQVVERCMVAPSLDLELDDLVHLGGDAFVMLSQRLAEIASHLVHRNRSARPAIELRSIAYHTAESPRRACIEIRFDNVSERLRGPGPIRGFTLLDRAGHPSPWIYRVCLAGNKVFLHLTQELLPEMKLHYGYGFDPACNLTDARGMAVPAFGPVSIS